MSPLEPKPASDNRTPQPLTPLPESTQTKLRSTLLIPTLPHLLSELLHNSLDAKAGKIDIWIDSSKDGMSIRVEDDGHGMDFEGLKRVGCRWRSSKGGSWAGGAGYGFRGEALASIAALGLLEIITRPSGSVETYAKVIRTSKVLFEGVSTRSLGRERGTTVLVKDLYLDIPIRQAALAATSNTAVASCKKVVEILALVRPELKWTLWEETAVGSSMTGPKKILSLHGAKNSVEVFRSLYGVAGVESVQSIRVSSGKKRIDGFISLQGGITKSHQHLYVNGHPLDRCEIHAVISKRFTQSKFSAMTDDGLAEFTPLRSNRRSPRRLERHPIYVLNVQIPSAELDALPGKTVMGYKDEEGVKSFVLAVAEEFLRRHDFISLTKASGANQNPARAENQGLQVASAYVVPRPTSTPGQAHRASPTLKPPDTLRLRTSSRPFNIPMSPSVFAAPAKTSHIHMTRQSDRTPKRPLPTPILNTMLSPATPLYRPHSVTNRTREPLTCPSGIASTMPSSTPILNSSTPFTPSTRPASALSGPRTARLGFSQSVRSSSGIGERRKAQYTMDDSGRKRYKWIDEILADVDSGVLPFTPKTDCPPCTTFEDTRYNTTNPDMSYIPSLSSIEPYRPSSKVTFSGTSLASARILGQIDTKFICAIIPSDSDKQDQTIVLIDQHAADERVSVEVILQELCEGFMSDSIPVTQLAGPLPAIILTREEAVQLVRPGVNDVIARWGIQVDLTYALRSAGEVIETRGDYIQIPIRAVPTSLQSRLGRKEATEMTRLVRLYLGVLELDLGQVQALLVQADRGGKGKGDWGRVLRWMPKEMLDLANSKACRNAIMFGDHLSVDQCERLVYQLGKTRFPFMCAHGRPSMVPLTKLEGVKDYSKRTVNWEAWKGSSL